MIALYKNAFALVFPTFFGPDNLPPLEAFALQCPVIASKVPGSTEQLGDAAILFDPKNPEEIANSILSVYLNPGVKQQLIEKGMIRARDRSWTEFINEIILLLDNFEKIRRCWE
jgi:glycosyltransferase involved in cell wall biosynthesis